MTTTSPISAPARPPPPEPNPKPSGPSADPTWARPALIALLTATAILYVWGLGASGWANSFYSAAVHTLSCLAIYLRLHAAIGAQGANAVALLLTAVANRAANRRGTFGVTGNADQGRHHLQGLIVFAVGLALTSGSLIVLQAITTPDRPWRWASCWRPT